VHPAQDEFTYMLEGTFDLYLAGAWTKAGAGDLVRMPRGIPHGYYNRSEKPARALFWVTPAGRLRALFDQLNDLGDVEEVVRRSAAHEVDFLPPGSVPGGPDASIQNPCLIFFAPSRGLHTRWLAWDVSQNLNIDLNQGVDGSSPSDGTAI
jgi:uncharacterized RmlC-like cupin family protein